MGKKPNYKDLSEVIQNIFFLILKFKRFLEGD